MGEVHLVSHHHRRSSIEVVVLSQVRDPFALDVLEGIPLRHVVDEAYAGSAVEGEPVSSVSIPLFIFLLFSPLPSPLSPLPSPLSPLPSPLSPLPSPLLGGGLTLFLWWNLYLACLMKTVRLEREGGLELVGKKRYLYPKGRPLPFYHPFEHTYVNAPDPQKPWTPSRMTHSSAVR